MSSNSYSALLRRSKLASYSPSIEQVYSTHGGQAARSNFGLKRPLPSASTKKAPFVRVTALDTSSRRTEFRKATREATFVKKWGELNVGISQTHASTAADLYDGGRPSAQQSSSSSPFDTIELQSRFVRGDGPGTIKSVDRAELNIVRAPNVFAMAEDEFERFLDQLAERREEFREFAYVEAAKANGGDVATKPVAPATLSPEEVKLLSAEEQRARVEAQAAYEEALASYQEGVGSTNLFQHAQGNLTHLTRLLERFLATAPPAPFSHPHPYLSLQYSSPTPLESALSPPIPGRILGPSPIRSRTYGGSSSAQNYTSILGKINPLASAQSGGQSSTTFFPDANGTRSNLPGRAQFILKPSLSPQAFIARQALSAQRGTTQFRPSTPSYQPQALTVAAGGALSLNPIARNPSNVVRPLPGTQAYSGDLPPSRSSPSSRFNTRSLGGGAPSLLTELVDSNLSSRRFAGGPKKLAYGDANRRSRDENVRFRNAGQALLEERMTLDKKAFGSSGSREGRKSVRHGKGSEGGKSGLGKKENRKGIVADLEALLSKEDGGKKE